MTIAKGWVRLRLGAVPVMPGCSTIPQEDRRPIYELRSALVHHGHLLDIDMRRPWGALVPRQVEQVDTHDNASIGARTAITSWLLDQ